MSISPILLANLFQHAETITALCVEREEIASAVRDYHFALDTREHGNIAANHALSVIQSALAMPWIQDAERKRREVK